jgi:hypothetical protein
MLQRRLLHDRPGVHRQRMLHSTNPGPDLCWRQVRQRQQQLRSNRQLRHMPGANLPGCLVQQHDAILQLHAGHRWPAGPELQWHGTALLQREYLLHRQPGLHGKWLLPTNRHLPRGRLRPSADRVWRHDQLRQLHSTNVQIRVLRQQHLLVHQPDQRAARDQLHYVVLQWNLLRHGSNVLQRDLLLCEHPGVHRQWVLHPCQPIHNLRWQMWERDEQLWPDGELWRLCGADLQNGNLRGQ